MNQRPLTRKRTIELNCKTQNVFNNLRTYLQDKYVLTSKVYSMASGIGVFTIIY
jgi:hypothetical protein